MAGSSRTPNNVYDTAAPYRRDTVTRVQAVRQTTAAARVDAVTSVVDAELQVCRSSSQVCWRGEALIASIKANSSSTGSSPRSCGHDGAVASKPPCSAAPGRSACSRILLPLPVRRESCPVSAAPGHGGTGDFDPTRADASPSSPTTGRTRRETSCSTLSSPHPGQHCLQEAKPGQFTARHGDGLRGVEPDVLAEGDQGGEAVGGERKNSCSWVLIAASRTRCSLTAVGAADREADGVVDQEEEGQAGLVVAEPGSL
jgi:hypothetical protein